MVDHDIGATLRALDEDYGKQPVSPLGAMVTNHGPAKSSLRLGWVAAGVGVLAATTAAVIWIALPPFQLAGFEVQTQTKDFAWSTAPDHTLRVTRGVARLRLTEAKADVEVSAGTRVQKTSDGARVHAGRARFLVEKQAGPRPFVVQVSSGRIEVLGTVFTVEQRKTDGRVDLASGRLRFVTNSGENVLLNAGDHVEWPLPAPKPVDVTPPSVPREPMPVAPTPVPASKKPTARQDADVEVLLRELETLKIRREYEMLARRIKTALPHIRDAALRESLSFEQCDTLDAHLGDVAAACACFEAHQAQYPKGPYALRAGQAMRRLACAPAKLK